MSEQNSKTITRTKIYLPIPGMILTVALAVSAAAQQQVPFKGTFQGDDTVTLPTITQRITGTGTHVGQFSSTTFLTLGPSGGNGSGQWIAANGDTIDTTVVGSGVHADDGGRTSTRSQVVGAQSPYIAGSDHSVCSNRRRHDSNLCRDRRRHVAPDRPGRARPYCGDLAT